MALGLLAAAAAVAGNYRDLHFAAAKASQGEMPEKPPRPATNETPSQKQGN
jgi:hypothetical protein